MTDPSDDELIAWQDVLDEVVAGRRSGLRCPFCTGGQIKVEETPRGLLLSCSQCGRYIEGSPGPE